MLILRGMGDEYDPDAPLPLGWGQEEPTRGGAIVDEKRRTMTFTEPEIITGKLSKKPTSATPWLVGGGVLGVLAYVYRGKLRRLVG